MNGDRDPVSFNSKTFSLAEKNYEIYDCKLLAIIRVLEEWRHYIQGSPHTTVILSDHKNLTYYREAKKLNRQQAQWSLCVSEFDVKLVHTLGSKMVQSDALSQQPDLCPDNDTDNENMIMLPDNMFLNLIDMDLQQKIVMMDDLDVSAPKALKLLLETAPTSMTKGLEDWKIKTTNRQNILFFKGKNYITRNMPGPRTFVKNYVSGCGTCQQFKINRHNYILVMVDQGLLKGVILIPCNKTLTSKKQHNYFWKIFINDSDSQTR